METYESAFIRSIIMIKLTRNNPYWQKSEQWSCLRKGTDLAKSDPNNVFWDVKLLVYGSEYSLVYIYMSGSQAQIDINLGGKYIFHFWIVSFIPLFAMNPLWTSVGQHLTLVKISLFVPLFPCQIRPCYTNSKKEDWQIKLICN